MSYIAPLAGDQPPQTTDYKRCCVCQKQGGQLVLNPRTTSYDKLLEVVRQRATVHDHECGLLQKRLEGCTKETLQRDKAVWHRVCYSKITNAVQLHRAMDRYQISLSTMSHTPKRRGRRSKSADDVASLTDPAVPFTRSSTQPLIKNLCFFCQEDSDKQLINVRTENAGQQLKKAVDACSDPQLKIRYSNCIADGDAHALDLKYHKMCWTTNVFNVMKRLERNEASEGGTREQNTMQVSSYVELLNIIDFQTRQGHYLSIEDVESTYIGMLGGTEALERHTPIFCRKTLKEKILSDLPHVKSARQKNMRNPSVLYCPEACEVDMVDSAINHTDDTDNMKTLYKSAAFIRRRIETFSKSSQGSLAVTSSLNDVPVELYSMIRWIMAGPAHRLQTKVRASIVDQAALTVSQNIMFGFKSHRQMTYKPSVKDTGFRFQQDRENPQVVGLALTVHHDTRNKKLVELLNAQGYCISYTRALIMETALANAVVENTKQFHGLYVPPFLKKGMFIFFAADNSDYDEDTPDGKNTLHGTIIVVYQKADATGDQIAPPICVDHTKSQSLSITPYHTPILHCQKPKTNTSYNQMRKFSVNKSGVAESYRLTQLGWVVLSAISRMKDTGISRIPGWAGYNSLLSTSQPMTAVGALPLLPEVAHDWSTLLTVMKQAILLKELAVGEDHITVITFDMALYEKAIKLVDTHPDLKDKVMPRLGELHAVMCALRALGSSIENSGIDDAWIEADVYGPSTTRQILKCTHYKRSLRAHIYSYMALYELAMEQFLKENPDLIEVCKKASHEMEEACSVEDKSTRPAAVHQANANSMQTLTQTNFMKRLQDWEAQKSHNAMFHSLMNYLHRVEAILYFISASRNGDLHLHLQAGEALSKLFFAMDRIKYKRLWPRYLADMKELKTKHPDTWRELEEGSISVTKSTIPFVSIGADHACEQINRIMKVQGGITGISNNPNARQRFFLTAPELSCLARDFKNQFHSERSQTADHHDLSPGKVKREHDTATRIKEAIASHGNPFCVEGGAIHNLITHAYVPDEYVPQILNIDNTGQKLYEDYVSERINGDVSLWDPVKKQKNMMYTSGNKKHAVKIRDKTVELKETKDLFGRLMVLARSNRDIDQKQALGSYEFTLTPRSLFTPDGEVLPCNDKSKLMHSLQTISTNHTMDQQEQMNDPTTSNVGHCQQIAIVDGMVLVQKLSTRAAALETVKDLSVYFNDRLVDLTKDYDEVIVVFDTYRAGSLKKNTRQRRQKGNDPVKYQVRDETRIRHVTLSRFLSHDETKSHLTEYLAEKILDYNRGSSKLVIVSAAGRTQSNKDAGPLIPENNHEEADTLMVCLGVSAAERNPQDACMTFFSPDTDVLILVIANYDRLPKKTSVSMTSSVKMIEPIWTALGPDRAKALPGLHAFTGADTTGRFNGIGKQTWFKLFLDTEDVVDALGTLCSNADVSEEIQLTLEQFVCTAYQPKGIKISGIPELRWYMFCKYMAESQKLPPTLGALKQHILRAHVQARVWGQATVYQQELLDPLGNGYHMDSNGQLKPTTTDVPPAPDAIVEMVRCQCQGNCSSNRCSCKSKELLCTDLCLCSTHCDNDVDTHYANCDSDDDSDG